MLIMPFDFVGDQAHFPSPQVRRDFIKNPKAPGRWAAFREETAHDISLDDRNCDWKGSMTREEFASFVEQTIEEVIHLAEEKGNRELPRHIAFQWLGRSSPYVTENIVEQVVQRVFVDEDHIYPC